MTTNSLSIITVRGVDCQGESVQNIYRKNDSVLKNVFNSCLSVLAVITFCVLFAVPWKIIPRSNSIIQQSHWLEVFYPVCTSFVLSAGSVLLDLINWIKERTLIRKKINMFPFSTLKLYCHSIFLFLSNNN